MHWGRGTYTHPNTSTTTHTKPHRKRAIHMQLKKQIYNTPRQTNTDKEKGKRKERAK